MTQPSNEPTQLPPDSRLRCPACNVELEFRFVECVFGTWPRHCDGKVMVLVSTSADTATVLMQARGVVWSIADGNSVKEFTR